MVYDPDTDTHSSEPFTPKYIVRADIDEPAEPISQPDGYRDDGVCEPILLNPTPYEKKLIEEMSDQVITYPPGTYIDDEPEWGVQKDQPVFKHRK